MLEAKIDHLLAEQEEVKAAIILASEKLEKRWDLLGKMMSRTQNVNSKKISVSQIALELAAKGHKVKHERYIDKEKTFWRYTDLEYYV